MASPERLGWNQIESSFHISIAHTATAKHIKLAFDQGTEGNLSIYPKGLYVPQVHHTGSSLFHSGVGVSNIQLHPNTVHRY